MARPGKYDSFLTGRTTDQLVEIYRAAGDLPENPPVINPAVSRAGNRRFDLAVKTQVRTLQVNESSGLIIKNNLSHNTRVHDYGILSRMIFSGAVRYQPGKKGKIFRVHEETITCETLKENTSFDIFFSYDGMIGTTAGYGGANFNISLTAAYEDELKTLSKTDGINNLGAKTCKGEKRLKDNFVKARGTRVTFVIHYEINMAAFSGPMSVSEAHFQSPGNNFFKIVTKG